MIIYIMYILLAIIIQKILVNIVIFNINSIKDWPIRVLKRFIYLLVSMTIPRISNKHVWWNSKPLSQWMNHSVEHSILKLPWIWCTKHSRNHRHKTSTASLQVQLYKIHFQLSIIPHSLRGKLTPKIKLLPTVCTKQCTMFKLYRPIHDFWCLNRRPVSHGVLFLSSNTNNYVYI